MFVIRLIGCYFFILAFRTFGQSVELVWQGGNSSYRALSVVDDNVAWVAGSNGYVGRTTDGGINWQFNRVNGYENLDFRSLHAFNRHKAILANAGSPACILITADGGKTWKQVYRNIHNDAFIDGMDFWNKREGILYGDPIDSRMLLLRTRDGGKSWKPVKQSPQLEKGEASFAASGTGIRCFTKTEVVIATGGAASRLWHSTDKGETWTSLDVPVIQGEGGTGIFSVGMQGNTWVVVGGDYQKSHQTDRHVFYSTDAGKTWHAPEVPTRGYRECVEYAGNGMWLAAGPTGVEVSTDNGITWQPLSEEQGFHTVRKARNGRLVLIAGSRKLGYVQRKN